MTMFIKDNKIINKEIDKNIKSFKKLMKNVN